MNQNNLIENCPVCYGTGQAKKGLGYCFACKGVGYLGKPKDFFLREAYDKGFRMGLGAGCAITAMFYMIVIIILEKP